MRRKFRLLLTTAVATLLFVACGSETNENALDGEKTEETVEVQATETEIAAAEELEESTTEDPNSSNDSTSSTEDHSDEAQETETTSGEVEESTNPADEAKETVDTINPLNQKAIEQILAITGLNVEEHRYYIAEETEEYIEVEISEKTEQGNTPLEGIYRYFPETGEILVRDYLTGEFIPYENLTLD